jgi:hypothetical protein
VAAPAFTVVGSAFETVVGTATLAVVVGAAVDAAVVAAAVEGDVVAKGAVVIDPDDVSACFVLPPQPAITISTAPKTELRLIAQPSLDTCDLSIGEQGGLLKQILKNR